MKRKRLDDDNDLDEGDIAFGDDDAVEQMTGKRKGRPRSRLGCLVGIFVIVAAVVLAYQYLLRPLFESGFGMADTREVPGDPANFDPVAALPGVAAFAGAGAKLTSIDASYVRSDGTMDLTATYTPGPRVTYEFAVPTNPPADAPPLGAGGGGPWYQPISIEAYQPGQWRHVMRMGGGFSTEYDYMNKGMDRDADHSPTTSPDDFIPDPACSFADLWQVAIQKQEAPTDAVAVINYDSDGYSFSIRGTGVSLDFDVNCKLTS